MNRVSLGILGLVFMVVCAPGPLSAQQQPPPAPEESAERPAGELRQAMRRYFQNQLRLELALSDEQMAELGPRVERIEDARSRANRARAATMRELRLGLREGAADDQLQSLLDRLETIENDQRAEEGSAMAEIDGMLTVRQRVQFRFFIQRFRQELQRRVQQLRRDRLGEPGPGFGDSQRPPARRP